MDSLELLKIKLGQMIDGAVYSSQADIATQTMFLEADLQEKIVLTAASALMSGDHARAHDLIGTLAYLRLAEDANGVFKRVLENMP